MADPQFNSTHPCALYKYGHTVHFIQAKLAFRERDLGIDGVVVSVSREVITIRTDDGDCKRFRNHDPERLVSIMATFGNRVVILRQGVLGLPHEEGSLFCFSVLEDLGVPLEPCVDLDDVPKSPAEPTKEELAKYLADRLRGSGGFVAEMQSLADRGDD